MAAILGVNCKSYYLTDGTDPPTAANLDTGTTASQSITNFQEATEITGVSIDGSTATADVSRRGGGSYRQKVPTLKEGTVTFDIIGDTSNTDNILFNILSQIYITGEPIDMLFANGDITATGGTHPGSNTAAIRGFRAGFSVTNFSESQQLEEANVYNVTLEINTLTPTPGYYEVSGTSTLTLLT